MNSELAEYGKDREDFRLVQASGEYIHLVWWDYVWKEISPRMEL
jgi:hypothetical protein